MKINFRGFLLSKYGMCSIQFLGSQSLFFVLDHRCGYSNIATLTNVDWNVTLSPVGPMV